MEAGAPAPPPPSPPGDPAGSVGSPEAASDAPLAPLASTGSTDVLGEPRSAPTRADASLRGVGPVGGSTSGVGRGGLNPFFTAPVRQSPPSAQPPPPVPTAAVEAPVKPAQTLGSQRSAGPTSTAAASTPARMNPFDGISSATDGAAHSAASVRGALDRGNPFGATTGGTGAGGASSRPQGTSRGAVIGSDLGKAARGGGATAAAGSGRADTKATPGVASPRPSATQPKTGASAGNPFA